MFGHRIQVAGQTFIETFGSVLGLCDGSQGAMSA